jgi:hypothetical protein
MSDQYQQFASKMRKDLFKSLKLMSVAEGTSLQALLEEAVSQYLEKRCFTHKTHQVQEKQARYSVSFDVSSDNRGEDEEYGGGPES